MKKGLILIQSVIIISLILFSGCTVQDNSEPDNIPDGLYVSSSGEKDFLSIQTAIDASSENETIYVFSGIYKENVIINKTITLMGENPVTTIIDGNKSGNVLTVSSAKKCNISGFTIQNSGLNNAGIDLSTPYNNITNNIFQDNYDGIYDRNGNYNIIKNNKFISHARYGVYLSGSDFNSLVNNQFLNNSYGVRIKARNNEVMQNTFKNNGRGLYFCCYAEKNLVYHNNFLNNTVWNAKDNYKGQIWHSDDLSEGNYWDDYTGTDSDGDGIGDTPYNITSDGTKQDLYPLINPLSFN